MVVWRLSYRPQPITIENKGQNSSLEGPDVFRRSKSHLQARYDLAPADGDGRRDPSSSDKCRHCAKGAAPGIAGPGGSKGGLAEIAAFIAPLITEDET